MTFDDVNRAVDYARRDAVQIFELCTIAGCPQLAASFVLNGTSVDAVKRNLTGMATHIETPSADARITRQAPARGTFDPALIVAAAREGKRLQ